MRFTRQHTKPGLSPYEGANFLLYPVVRDSDVTSANTSIPSQIGQVPANWVSFPDTWSSGARNICVVHGFVEGGIASSLILVPEDDVPEWLWRHEPADSAPKSEMETSLCQVIDRICGGVVYQGWKAGYFDAEEDASAFHDELRWLLFHQKISPNIAFWRHAATSWAYGHSNKFSKSIWPRKCL